MARYRLQQLLRPAVCRHVARQGLASECDTRNKEAPRSVRRCRKDGSKRGFERSELNPSSKVPRREFKPAAVSFASAENSPFPPVL